MSNDIEDNQQPPQETSLRRLWFAHIEEGNSHPLLGKIFGLIGFALGILPVSLIAMKASISIFVVQIEAPGLAGFEAIAFCTVLFLPISICYKLAHENGGSVASQLAFRGFSALPLSILVAFLFVFAGRFLGLRVWMP